MAGKGNEKRNPKSRMNQAETKSKCLIHRFTKWQAIPIRHKKNQNKQRTAIKRQSSFKLLPIEIGGYEVVGVENRRRRQRNGSGDK